MLSIRFLSVTAASLLVGLGSAAPAVSAPPGATVTVTSPAADSVHPVNSSLFVGWRNDTGQEVDVWLAQGDGAGGTQRVFKLASKASSKPTSELVAAVPAVPSGTEYTVEVTTRETGVHGYSAPFEVGPVRANGPGVGTSTGIGIGTDSDTDSGSGSGSRGVPWPSLSWVQAQDGHSPR
ncbi:Ser-Thr-rich GPI-anchored membrane family protein [Streptomyces sp. NPDC056341]|uniref:Ser-Thr-rich GPI-anchored membrane family protein n=1 Tax=Streptomyces sp. NPDC056341 TaxID=3345788 RepID=UPI0035D8751C